MTLGERGWGAVNSRLLPWSLWSPPLLNFRPLVAPRVRCSGIPDAWHHSVEGAEGWGCALSSHASSCFSDNLHISFTRGTGPGPSFLPHSSGSAAAGKAWAEWGSIPFVSQLLGRLWEGTVPEPLCVKYRKNTVVKSPGRDSALQGPRAKMTAAPGLQRASWAPALSTSRAPDLQVPFLVIGSGRAVCFWGRLHFSQVV